MILASWVWYLKTARVNFFDYWSFVTLTQRWIHFSGQRLQWPYRNQTKIYVEMCTWNLHLLTEGFKRNAVILLLMTVTTTPCIDVKIFLSKLSHFSSICNINWVSSGTSCSEEEEPSPKAPCTLLLWWIMSKLNYQIMSLNLPYPMV